MKLSQVSGLQVASLKVASLKVTSFLDFDLRPVDI